MKNISLLFVVISAMVAVLPGRADTIGVPWNGVPASDAALNEVNQAFDIRKVRPNTPLPEKAVISRDIELQPAIEQSMAPQVTSVPNAVSAPPVETLPEPLLRQEAQRPTAVLPTLDNEVRPDPPVQEKTVVSRDIEPPPVIEQSMAPQVTSVPNAVSAPPPELLPEPLPRQEAQRPTAVLPTPDTGEDRPVFVEVITQPPRVPQVDDIQAVEEVITRWSTAWSEQNVPTYLSLYSPQFRPPGASSLPAWANQRTSRLQRPKFIVHTLQDVRIDQIQSGVMQVRFRQSYQSDLYSDAVRKQLDLEKTAEGWKILRETVLP